MAQALFQPIREIAYRGAFSTLPNQELLDRYTTQQDQDAFTELVRRHAGVVWKVCQSILPRPDAEDAFQASFVILSRKASRVHGESLSGWLYRVAYRVSLRVWRNHKRQKMTPLSPDLVASKEDGHLAWRELQTLLQIELARLSEKYRVVFLLCVLEGISKAEAASRLAIPEGTVSSRLATARELLRKRLHRRGIELPAVLTALTISSTVSASLIRQTAQIATQSQSIPVAITRLIDGGMSPFLYFKPAMFSLLFVSMIVGTAWLPGNDFPPETEPPVKQVPNAEQQVEVRRDLDGDPLPPEALFRFGTSRFRRANGFLTTALSSDGQRLASMGSAGVFIWDLQTGRVIRQLPPMWVDTYEQERLAFVDKDRRLVVCSRWQTGHMITVQPELKIGEFAKVWDLETGQCTLTWRIEEDRSTSGPGGIWPIDQGKKLMSIAVRIDPQQQALETVMILWDVLTGKELERHTSDQIITRAIDYNPVKDCFVCMRKADKANNRLPYGDTLFVLDRKTGKEIWSTEDKGDVPAQVSMSPDGAYLSIARHNSLELVTLATKKKEKLKAPTVHWGGKAIFLPDSKSMLYTDYKTLYQIEAKPDAIPQKRATLTAASMKLHLLPNGKEVVGADDHDLIRQIDFTTGKEVQRAENYRVMTKVVAQRRGTLVAVTDPYGKLDLWDSHDGKLVRNLRPGRPKYGQPAYALAFSPNDQILASATTAGVIDLWSIPDGKLLHSIPIGKEAKDKIDGADYVQFSNDSKRLYFLPRDRPTACIDVETGKRIELEPWWNQFGMILPATNQVLMPSGQMLDLTTGKQVGKISHKIQSHWQLFRGNVSGDGRRFCGPRWGEKGLHLCVWDVQIDKEIFTSEPLQGHGLTAMRLHPDGKWLTAFIEDGTVRVWEVASGQQVYQIEGLNYHVWQTMELGPRGRSVVPINDMSPMLYSLRPLDTPKEFSSELWNQLADKPSVAYRAQWALLDHPDKTIKLLTEKLPPDSTQREQAWFDDLVKKLDSKTFKVREAASNELSQSITEIPKEWIVEALKKNSSTEVQDRLKRLSEEHEQTHKKHAIRLDRTVQVVEMLDTQAARKLLTAWSKGAAITNLKESALAALKRLEQGK